MGNANLPPTPPASLEAFDPETVLLKLTIDEKIGLLSGVDFWHTRAIARLGVPSIRFSDGPNGVRGTRFFNGAPAACLPCGTALGATWNIPLLEQAGNLLGEEAIAKGAHVLLGPTVNIPRSPLGGRAFESFSEDPVLAGYCAASIVRGVQQKNIVASIKHFVANDQEHERMAVDSLITQRALREVYLLPFQIAVRDSRPGVFMTAYNKVNGTHVSEHPGILRDILRGEWGWKGAIISDWYGTYSTVEALNAGLDLEMPGPTRWRGPLLNHSLLSKKISGKTLNARVLEILKLVNRTIKSGVPQNALEGSRNTRETSDLLRVISAESIVLLKNQNQVLPLQKSKSVAVIGPSAKNPAHCGGGSASLLPYYVVTPFDGIASKFKSLKYSVGCYSHKMLPLLGPRLRTSEGAVGVTFKAFIDPPSLKNRNPVDIIYTVDTNMYLVDYYHSKLTEDLYWAEVEGFFTPDQDGDYEFGLAVFGTGKLYLDGEMLIDNETAQRSGGTFFNVGTVEETGVKYLKAGVTYKLMVEFASGVTSKLTDADGVVSFGAGGIRIGGARVIDPQEEIRKAVDLARSVDQVVLCIGLNQDWEEEGKDREHMDLPGYTDDLIHAVADANPNTVIVIQSGTPVTMPWVDKVSAIVLAWYGGNETGNAIADVLYGDVNPSGKLPLSVPVHVEDNPAFLNFGSERGRVLYGEDVYVGYRFYEATKRPTLFPFGHGLSYTTFKLSRLEVRNDGEMLSIQLSVENTGGCSGSTVIQVYVAQRSPSVNRPPKELKGFKKQYLGVGESKLIEIQLETRYTTSFWDEAESMWISEKDTYEVSVGDSSTNTSLKALFEVKDTFWWSGV